MICSTSSSYPSQLKLSETCQWVGLLADWFASLAGTARARSRTSRFCHLVDATNDNAITSDNGLNISSADNQLGTTMEIIVLFLADVIFMSILTMIYIG